MTKITISEEELAQLTPAEREGLLDENLLDDPEPGTDDEDEIDDDDEDKTVGDEPETDPNDETDPDPGESDNEDEVDDDDDAAAAAAAVDAANAAGADEDDDDDDDALSGLPSYEIPADIDAKLAALQTKRKSALQAFNEGDLSAEEYDAELARIGDETGDLKASKIKSELAVEMHLSRWNKSIVPAFLKENPSYNTNEVLFGMLDKEVRAIQVEKKGSEFNPANLRLAHKRVQQAIAAATGQPPPKPKPAKPAKKPEIVLEKPRRAPRTLAFTPQAEPQDTSAGRFAHLDRLANRDPAAFDKALEAMTAAQRDAYLAAG